MIPEISEFSYGFALTNEIVGWAPLRTAPIFPSLIEEGKAGGGYDVKLDMRGVPLYLQFKRSDCLTRRSAREIKHYGLPIDVPFFRFAITPLSKSDQHELLIELAGRNPMTFYVAPRFHRIAEINHYWSAHQMASESIFVRPGEIGHLDDAAHHVAFDGRRTYVCSEPKEIAFFDGAGVLDQLQSALDADPRPLREKLSEIAQQVDGAERTGRARAEARRQELAASRAATGDDTFVGSMVAEAIDTARPVPQPARPIPFRAERRLTPEEQQLRDTADTVARSFAAQMIIVQPK